MNATFTVNFKLQQKCSRPVEGANRTFTFDKRHTRDSFVK